jgi:hypothetical protein
MERAVPNILVRYRPAEDDEDPAAAGGTAYALIYVRPETNRLFYESEILSAVRRRAEVVYMANLNGRLFLERGILASHYASQFRFARDPRAFLACYPELAACFLRHFGVGCGEAEILSSFEAVERGLFTAEELFADIVQGEDFLACYGQTFKRLGGKYIVNYDLPAIASRYTPEANVFAVLVRARRAPGDFYVDLNRAIYEEMISRPETPILFGDKLRGLSWSERVRRTYHLSKNPLMAMFDMADFVFLDDERRLGVEDTPLGARLLASGAIDRAGLVAAKDSQLCRLSPGPGYEEGLVYLPLPGPALESLGARELLGRCAARLRPSPLVDAHE